VSSTHPGVIRTKFGFADAGSERRVLSPLVWPFMRLPEQGAETSAWLVSPEVEGSMASTQAGTAAARVPDARARSAG
jgi:hypothetical protein